MKTDGQRPSGRTSSRLARHRTPAHAYLEFDIRGGVEAVTAGVIVNSGFRSRVEDRWFAAARSAQGKDLKAFRKVDAELVDQEAKLLGAALKSVFESLHDKVSVPIVGHSPTTEAAVFGLTGVVVGPVVKGRRNQGRRGGRPLQARGSTGRPLVDQSRCMPTSLTTSGHWRLGDRSSSLGPQVCGIAPTP